MVFEKQKKEWGVGTWVRVGFGAFVSLILFVMAILVLLGVDVSALLVAIPTILIAVVLFGESLVTKLYFGRREVIHWKNMLHLVSLLFSSLLLYIGITMLPAFTMIGLETSMRTLNGWILLIGALTGIIEAFVD